MSPNVQHAATPALPSHSEPLDVHVPPVPSSYEKLAEEVAWSGLHRAVRRLARTFSSMVFSGAHPHGTYDVLVLTSETEATVTSFGTVMDAQGQPVVQQLRQVVILEDELDAQEIAA